MDQRNNSQVVSKFFKKEDIDFLKKLNEHTEDLKKLFNEPQQFEKTNDGEFGDIKKEKVK